MTVPRKPTHRRSARHRGQRAQVLFQPVNLQLPHILNRNADVLERFANSADALVKHAAKWGVAVRAKVSCAGQVALRNIVLQAVHEIGADLVRLLDGQKALEKHIHPNQAHERERQHDVPSALHQKLEDIHIHLGNVRGGNVGRTWGSLKKEGGQRDQHAQGSIPGFERPSSFEYWPSLEGQLPSCSTARVHNRAPKHP